MGTKPTQGMVRRAFLRRAGQAAVVVVGGGVIAKVTASAARANPRRMHAAAAGQRADTMARMPEQAATMARMPEHAATMSQCSAHDDLPGAPDAAVRAFLGPIGEGTEVGAWTVERVHGVFRGALPFVLRNDAGRKVQIDLMAAGADSPPGVASTERGQLYIVNSGRGNRFTPADLEQATRLLAALIGERETRARLELMTLGQRQACHPRGVFVVPL
jgi:hypothetical protein